MKEPCNDPFNINGISEEVRQYIDMKIAATKLTVVESLSRLFGNALKLLVFIFLCLLALIAFFTAAIISLGLWIGSYVWAALIVGAVCIVVGIILFSTKKLFINPMVGMFSKMFFPLIKDKDYDDA